MAESKVSHYLFIEHCKLCGLEDFCFFWIVNAMKRFLDLVLSCSGLVFLAPLMLLISAMILLTMGRPILFRQIRAGKNGVPFRMIKFRTMVENGMDEDGLNDEVRITRLGRFLRATSLDELPELLNVLKGEISLVGPRPLFVSYVSLYSKEQRRRLDVKPGITGWAQINGRNSIDWQTKFRLDVWYVDNQSMCLDILILLKTLKKVLLREGISSEGQATTEYFRGNKSD